MAASMAVRVVPGGAYRAVSGKTTTRHLFAFASAMNRTILSRLAARSCSNANWTTPTVSVAGRAGSRAAADSAEAKARQTGSKRSKPDVLITVIRGGAPRCHQPWPTPAESVVSAPTDVAYFDFRSKSNVVCPAE